MTFDEVVTGFNTSDLVVSNGTVSNFTVDVLGLVFSFDITPISDGEITIDIPADAAFDPALNGSAAAMQYSLVSDRTPPSATLVVANANLLNGQTSPVTIMFSEAVTGFTNADLTVANGTLSDVSTSDNITFTATLTPTAGITDTSNVITLRNSGVIDAADNTGPAQRLPTTMRLMRLCRPRRSLFRTRT